MTIATPQNERLWQYTDSLKSLDLRQVVWLAAVLGFVHGLSALAFPSIVPSSLLIPNQQEPPGSVEILMPGR